jgi:quercetin dioxygenase-like cupin family protein
MIRAYYLYTGEDGHSHVKRGSVETNQVIAAQWISFKESPPHSSLDWHNDPIPQYVLFLAGAVEFVTKTGETFVVQPGEVLIAVDHTGTGHTWKLVNDQPWVRAYVPFQTGANIRFTPD